MKKILLGLLVLSSLNCFAADAVQGKSSYYSKIEELFRVGVKPTDAELIGLQVGKCFDSKDSVKTIALLGRSEYYDVQAGPLSGVVFRASFVLNIRDDDKNALISRIESLSNGSSRYAIRWNTLFDLVDSENSRIMKDDEGHEQLVLKKVDGYIVVKGYRHNCYLYKKL